MHGVADRDRDDQKEQQMNVLQDAPSITQKQLAEYLDVDVATIERWAAGGALPRAFVTPSGRRRWRASDVNAWVESCVKD